MEIKSRYLLASVAVHAAAMAAVAVMEPPRHQKACVQVHDPIYFEIVEAAAPKSQERLQSLEKLDPLEKLESLEKLEQLEPLEPLESLEPLECLERLEVSPIPPAHEERAAILAAPVALNRIVPAYPRSARRKGHEGSVTVEFSIYNDGGVVAAEVAESSGHAELDRAALSAVETARFAPAADGGRDGRFRLTLDFRLN